MIDTPGRLLDAAERLFASHGYGAVSLRQIIAAAKVNVAAVHYHFGSKQQLLDAVIKRKADPVNRERLERFDGLAAQPAAPGVEQLLQAFLEPVGVAASKSPEFTRMMGRLQAEGILTQVIDRNFEPVLSRFLTLMRKATPEISESEFRWRVYFMQGAMANAMLGSLNRVGGPLEDEGFPARIERLIAFLSGAFRAPARRPDKRSASLE